MLRLVFSRRAGLTTLLVLVATAVLVCLGIWQIDRYAQSQAFSAHQKDEQAAPALVLSENLSSPDLTSMEYRAVMADGTFDFNRQVAIRNQVWTQSWGDDIGFSLLTPLVLSNGQAVWVERGWIPSQYNTPDAWRQFDEPGVVQVEGIIRLPLKKGEMGGGVPDPPLAAGQTRLDFWNYTNIERLQQQVPYLTLPIYIQQTGADSPTSLPYPLPPVFVVDDSPHLGFAMMWFFFAILLCVGYPYYLARLNLSADIRG
jgi:surfeit locus 1 family protein